MHPPHLKRWRKGAPTAHEEMEERWRKEAPTALEERGERGTHRTWRGGKAHPPHLKRGERGTHRTWREGGKGHPPHLKRGEKEAPTASGEKEERGTHLT